MTQRMRTPEYRARQAEAARETHARRSPEDLKRRADYQRQLYRANLEHGRAIKRRATQKSKAIRQPIIDAIKLERGCLDCGYRAHPAALHFDHRDPSTKLFGIARGLTRSWSSVLAEIEKCDVRCANCHAVRSVVEGHLGRPRLTAGKAPS